MTKITYKLASDLMDCLACLQYCATGEVNEEEVREIFNNLCDYYEITEVTDVPDDFASNN